MEKLHFGGSFNPIHHGHLICARAAGEAIGATRIILIPAGRAPHKPNDSSTAPANDRLQMCRCAISSNATFELDDREIHRPGPSYTIDTVREIKKDGQPVRWLIGADMVPGLLTWHQPQALLEEVTWVVMARPGWKIDWDRLPPPLRKLQRNVIITPMIDISATAIRQRIAQQLPIDYLCPPPVCDYIRQHKLYR